MIHSSNVVAFDSYMQYAATLEHQVYHICLATDSFVLRSCHSHTQATMKYSIMSFIPNLHHDVAHINDICKLHNVRPYSSKPNDICVVHIHMCELVTFTFMRTRRCWMSCRLSWRPSPEGGAAPQWGAGTDLKCTHNVVEHRWAIYVW